MILLTGAAGKTGRSVIRSLVDRGKQVRAFVHKPEQIEMIKGAGAQEAAFGEISDAMMFRQALKGVQAVYHIPPNMAPDEIGMGMRVIDAALEAGVVHFVYHSVLHPQAEDMPHHWQKMRVEEYLFKSGLNFTILQPTMYMQNILAYWAKIQQGIYPLPYAPETRLGMVDLEDVACAAALILEEPCYFGGTYELVGTPPLSQHEAAVILSEKLGTRVSAVGVPIGEWEAQARAAGMPDYARETLIKMFVYYERHGLWGSTWALQQLLGRPPVDFSEFVGRIVANQR